MRDAVTGVDDRADLGGDGRLRLIGGDEVLERRADLVGADADVCHFVFLD
jgi:hypothetical protein